MASEMQILQNSKWDKHCLPFSFQLDGKCSDGFLDSWTVSQKQRQDSKGLLTETEFKDSASGLSVIVETCKLEGFTVVEQVLYFVNNGKSVTPVIEKVFPIDLTVELDDRDRAYIHHAKGSSCVIDDFSPLVTELGQRYPNSKTISPAGGRSSDGVLPFMSLQLPDGGLTIAVGWTGQWSATFNRKDGGIQVLSGMEKTHLVLEANEKIRTPRILVAQWQGKDPIDGNNLLRKIILEHYTRSVEGEFTIPPIAHNTMYSHWLDKKSLTFENEVRAIEKGSELGIEAHWVDACWFATGNWDKEVGDWRIRREVFPDGLGPLAKIIHDHDMKFILWFEPERVCKNTPLALEHPDWMLKSETADVYLLNLGILEAREYITDLVSDYIERFGIDVYRQDFNIAPLPFWRQNDTSDRVGITEIKYIEGLYAFWDQLCKRHPNLVIDNCASGGRRIDLETTSRSYPLWRSDYSDVECLKFPEKVKHIGAQCQAAGLSRWVPLHAAAVWSFEPYDFRSAVSSGVVVYSDIRKQDFPSELAKQALDEMRRLRPYFLGDFYPLLSLNADFDQWCAYQYHCRETDAGFAMFFRRHESGFSTLEGTNLHAIEPDKKYAVSVIDEEYVDSPKKQEMSGRNLIEKTIIISDKPGSALLEYQQI